MVSAHQLKNGALVECLLSFLVLLFKGFLGGQGVNHSSDDLDIVVVQVEHVLAFEGRGKQLRVHF